MAAAFKYEPDKYIYETERIPVGTPCSAGFEVTKIIKGRGGRPDIQICLTKTDKAGVIQGLDAITELMGCITGLGKAADPAPAAGSARGAPRNQTTKKTSKKSSTKPANKPTAAREGLGAAGYASMMTRKRSGSRSRSPSPSRRPTQTARHMRNRNSNSNSSRSSSSRSRSRSRSPAAAAGSSKKIVIKANSDEDFLSKLMGQMTV